MPDSVITTSMRGRPSSASGTSVRRPGGRSCRSAAARPSAPGPARWGAFGLQVVGAPQHQATTRAGRGRRRVAGQQRSAWRGAVAHGKGAGDAEGVEAVQVAAGGQHLGVRSTSPPGAGRTKRPSSARSRPGARCRWPAGRRCRPAPSAARRRRRGRPARQRLRGWRRRPGLERDRRRPGPRRCAPRHGHSRSTRSAGVGAADHVQAVRDQRVLQLEHLLGQPLHGAASIAAPSPSPRPVRPAPGPARRPGPGSARSSDSRRWRLPPAGPGPRQRSSEAFRSSRPRYRPASRHRRREVADQRGAGAALGDGAFAGVVAA
jgi:hypothetical protein